MSDYTETMVLEFYETRSTKIKGKEKKQKIFKECGLPITTKANLKVVQFQVTELHLTKNTYRPYKKPNDNINVNSNHAPSIIKQIPSSINRRLLDLWSDEKFFLSNIQPHRKAFKKGGFRDELTYFEQKNFKKT